MDERRSLIIVGAGGFGREIRAWMREYRSAFVFRGFLDDAVVGPDVISRVSSHEVDPASSYLFAFGDGRSRMRVGRSFLDRGANVVSLVSPLGSSSSALNPVGGIYLGSFSVASDTQVGRFVLIQGFACIGHDVHVGDGATIGSHAFIGGGAAVGEGATLHPHSVVLPGVKVGPGAVVGAGSVVVRDVPHDATVFGNPAKLIFG